MEAMLNDAISTINGYLWSYFIIFILIGAGLFFTMTTNFVQIRMIKEMIRLVINGAGSSTEKNHVSSFQAFCVSTASRVGVGNIAGIAIAVVLGGPGAISGCGLSLLLVLLQVSSNLHWHKSTKNLLLKVAFTAAQHTTFAMV